MAYQKDTANTLVQVIDKFLSFCCLHGGYTRNPDSGTVKSIKKGDVNWNFDSALKTVDSYANYRISKVCDCYMSYGNGVRQQHNSQMAVWQFNEPFVAIDMFANQNECVLVVEVSQGVFTELAIGKYVNLSDDTMFGEFLVANGQTDPGSHTPTYANCTTHSLSKSSFFATPANEFVTKYQARSYVRLANTNSASDFAELNQNQNQYFGGHSNPLTEVLIARTPASNILRHTSPPLYFNRKNTALNMFYVAGYVNGVRPCTMHLLQPRDIIMDRWMAFPMTSVVDNSSMYPPCSMRGYLFDMGD